MLLLADFSFFCGQAGFEEVIAGKDFRKMPVGQLVGVLIEGQYPGFVIVVLTEGPGEIDKFEIIFPQVFFEVIVEGLEGFFFQIKQNGEEDHFEGDPLGAGGGLQLAEGGQVVLKKVAPENGFRVEVLDFLVPDDDVVEFSGDKIESPGVFG